jgi:hypothetical protein
MATTYEPIATTTLGSAASSVSFSSINSAYTDLRIIFNVIASVNPSGTRIQFNSDTATNYSVTILEGDGATASSTGKSNQTFIWGSYVVKPDTTTPALMIVDIFNYAGSTNKTSLISVAADKNGAADSGVDCIVGLWRSTSAITSINLFTASGANNYAAGSTATLYGILKA